MGVPESLKKRTEEDFRKILGEPNEEQNICFVVCFNHKDEWYISGDTDGVEGGYNAKELIDKYEVGFDKSHKRGYQGSMSAAINATFYKWCIIRVSFIDIASMAENLNLYKCWNIAGGATGMKLKKEYYHLFEDKTKCVFANMITEEAYEPISES